MKFINNSVALAAIILSTAVNTGCTTIEKKYKVNGNSISVERITTNRAHVEQLDVKEANGQTSISGQVILHTSARGPLQGYFYVDLIDSNSKTIKTVEESFSRSAVNIRQSAFTIDLGALPDTATKLVVSYGP